MTFGKQENKKLRRNNAALMHENDMTKGESRNLRNEFEAFTGRAAQADDVDLIAQSHGDEDQNADDRNMDAFISDEEAVEDASDSD